MMNRLTLGQRLGDHRLVSLKWVADGEDLQLEFEAPGSRGRVVLTARWATQVRINLDFGGYFGAPLVFSSNVDKADGGTGILLHLEFGGAPDGSLSLQCNEVIVE